MRFTRSCSLRTLTDAQNASFESLHVIVVFA
jgi:hypothetical protein